MLLVYFYDWILKENGRIPHTTQNIQTKQYLIVKAERLGFEPVTLDDMLKDAFHMGNSCSLGVASKSLKKTKQTQYCI